METAEVFFAKEISPQSLIKMFKLVGGNLNGKIAIKSTSHRRAAWPQHHSFPMGTKLQEQIPDSTIVECNVL